jgi:hypothetical protein
MKIGVASKTERVVRPWCVGKAYDNRSEQMVLQQYKSHDTSHLQIMVHIWHDRCCVVRNEIGDRGHHDSRQAVGLNTMSYSRFWHCGMALFALVVFAAGIRPARAITVQEVSVSPAQVVNITTTITPTGGGVPYQWTGNVYAGVNNLLVDQVAMQGFCIDPFHFSLPSSPGYSFIPLAGAPKGPGRLSNSDALLIERLWGTYYSANMSASIAAGLQLAIWDVVAASVPGSYYHLNGSNDYGASSFLAFVSNANYNGPVANLIALTGPGQDYVVQNVPETGATVLLLGLGCFGCVAIRRLVRATESRP